MPSLVAHYIVGKLVKEKLAINNEDFLFGCLLPDYIKESHFKTQGKMFLIPDIDSFIKNNNIKDKNIFFGYLTHLLLDKYFLEYFIPNSVYSKIDSSINIFTADKIYNEYTIISPYLLKKYNINLEELEECVSSYKDKINIQKFDKTIQEIQHCNQDIANLKYLNEDSFSTFLELASTQIEKDILSMQKKTKIKK